VFYAYFLIKSVVRGFMKKILILLCLFTASKVSAENFEQFSKSHQQKQQKLFASLDYCSNIGSKEIFQMGTKSLSLIKDDLENIKKEFALFKKQKSNCFDNTKDFLDTIIAENFIAMQTADNSTAIEQQNKVDQDFLESIMLRKQINISLIDSILSDIDKSLKNASKSDLINSFISESLVTRQLISQELNVIYKSMENQLALDQINLDIDENKSFNNVANISVRSSFLSLSRALLVFESIESKPKAYNVAKIKTYVDTAYNKLQELKSFSQNLDALDSKKDLNMIFNQLSIMSVDIDVVLKDLNDDDFSENYLNWAGMVYQQISDIVSRLQKVLDSIYILDLVKEPLPVDITIKTEELSFADSAIAKIKPVTLSQIKKADDEMKIN
jgi:hypothetical protein